MRTYWKDTPATVSTVMHSDTSYFVGFRVESVSISEHTCAHCYNSVYTVVFDILPPQSDRAMMSWQAAKSIQIYVGRRRSKILSGSELTWTRSHFAPAFLLGAIVPSPPGLPSSLNFSLSQNFLLVAKCSSKSTNCGAKNHVFWEFKNKAKILSTPNLC